MMTRAAAIAVVPMPDTSAVERPAASESGFARRSIDQPLRFTWREFSGSWGDLGTFLPLVLTMCLTSGFDLGAVLLWAGLLNVATGLWFRQPLPVQPMKALAAVAIAEQLTRADVAAAGVLMGAALVGLALAGAASWLARHIPPAVVRGIQLGIGVKLALTGVTWLSGYDWRLTGLVRSGAGLPWFGWDSVAGAVIVGGALLLAHGGARGPLWLRRVPVLLAVLVAGFIALALARPELSASIELRWPRLDLNWPETAASWWRGLSRAAAPQLPLTLLNSVVAVCALSAQYYPKCGIAPRRMALSVGLMNLVTVPLGGLPMCHGAGGLAAQYAFGARTGGSVIMLGITKMIAGLLVGGALMPLLVAYPRSILTVLLVFAGASLAAPARDCLRGSALVILLATTAVILTVNTAAGVICGLALSLALAGVARLRRPAAQST